MVSPIKSRLATLPIPLGTTMNLAESIPTTYLNDHERDIVSSKR